MKQQITIYLSGEGTFSSNSNWRKEVITQLYKIARYDDMKICVINPSNFASNYSITDRQIKSFLFDKIRKSDIVLCNLCNTENDPYTSAEVQYAVDNHINVIGIKGTHACTWIENVDCDAVFWTIEDAIDYVRKYYQIMSPVTME